MLTPLGVHLDSISRSVVPIMPPYIRRSGRTEGCFDTDDKGRAAGAGDYCSLGRKGCIEDALQIWNWATPDFLLDNYCNISQGYVASRHPGSGGAFQLSSSSSLPRLLILPLTSPEVNMYLVGNRGAAPSANLTSSASSDSASYQALCFPDVVLPLQACRPCFSSVMLSRLVPPARCARYRGLR